MLGAWAQHATTSWGYPTTFGDGFGSEWKGWSTLSICGEPVPGCLTVRADDEGVFRWDGPAREGDNRFFTTLAWRLTHIANVNGPWLAASCTSDANRRTGHCGRCACCTGSCIRGVEYGPRRHHDESLSLPIGEIAGRYGRDTRRSFVLHVVDELIHHGAECALLSRSLRRSAVC